MENETENEIEERALDKANNVALAQLSRRWALNGDCMECRDCGRMLIASRDGEGLRHRAGCKNGGHEHPWHELRRALFDVYKD